MICFTPLPLYFAEDNLCFIIAAWFTGPDVIIIIIIIITIIIVVVVIIIINCNWVVTRWQWLLYMYTKYEIGY